MVQEKSSGYTGRVNSYGAKSAAQKARNNPVLRFLARLGYAVSGVLHAVIGFIAIGVATGTGHKEADQSGALGQLAATPGGVFLLWVMVVGLAALGLWLLVSAFLFAGSAKNRVVSFVTDFVKGIVYLVLAYTALTFARGGSSNSAHTTSHTRSQILASPGGVFLVVLIGLVIIAVGIYLFVKGVTKRFTRDLTIPGGTVGRVTTGLGVFGYVAKGVALFVVGVLFAVAAFKLDPGKANGLDGALKSLATLPFGTVILIVIAAGFIAYGVYSFVRARFAHL
jgi:large-conductance mechanosensitive channel